MKQSTLTMTLEELKNIYETHNIKINNYCDELENQTNVKIPEDKRIKLGLSIKLEREAQDMWRLLK